MKYDAQEQQLIRDVFRALKAEGVRCVVPRYHDALPEGTPGGDVDILVRPENLNAAETCLLNLGFSRNKMDRLGGAKSKWKYYRDQLADLRESPSTIPHRIIRFCQNRIRGVLFKDQRAGKNGARTSGKTYRDERFYKANVMVHLVTHLAYVSTLNRKLILTDQRVVDSMLERTTWEDGIPAPSITDELVHLVCRGVFDRFGAFPDYYIERCKALAVQVQASEPETERLNELLTFIFYKAAPIALEAIRSSQYNTLREKLRRFADY